MRVVILKHVLLIHVKITRDFKICEMEKPDSEIIEGEVGARLVATNVK